VRVAVLQLSSQGMSNTKLYNYIRIAHKQGVKLLLLGEYIVNPFFKELEELSISMIKEQAQYQIKVLKELSSTYDITIVVPIVIVKKNKPYKTVAKFAPSSSAYYYQQLLINYSHWNEEKYFANDIQKLVSPLIFKINSIKFAILTGFELHFDEIFTFLKEKNIVTYDNITDDEAMDAFVWLSQSEGIIPAFESSHAIAYLKKMKPQEIKGRTILVNLSGRGDKDMVQAKNILNLD